MSLVCARPSKGSHEVHATISEMLARVGDKWSIMIVVPLSGPRRFNELRRRIDDISQKILASTLKVLDRDGFVARTVTPSVPRQVTHELPPLGRELMVPIVALAEWTAQNTDSRGRFRACRQAAK